MGIAEELLGKTGGKNVKKPTNIGGIAGELLSGTSTTTIPQTQTAPQVSQPNKPELKVQGIPISKILQKESISKKILRKAKEVKKNITDLPRGLQIAITAPFMSGEQINKRFPEFVNQPDDYAKRIGGTFFDVASLPFGAAELGVEAIAKKGVKLTGKKLLQQIAKTAAKRSVEGATFTGIRSASQGDKVKQIILNTGVGAVAAPIIGGTIGTAGVGVRSLLSKLKTPVIEKASQVIPEEVPKLTEKPSIVPKIEWKIGTKPSQQFDAVNNKSIITIRKDTPQETIWHEVAHSIDRQKPDLRIGLADEIKTITGKDYVNNESFADAFKKIAKDENLKTQAPKIAHIMENVELPKIEVKNAPQAIIGTNKGIKTITNEYPESTFAKTEKIPTYEPSKEDLKALEPQYTTSFIDNIKQKLDDDQLKYLGEAENRAMYDNMIGRDEINKVKTILRSKYAQQADFDATKIKGFDEIAQMVRDRTGQDLSVSEVLDLIDKLPTWSEIENKKPPVLKQTNVEKLLKTKYVIKEVQAKDSFTTSKYYKGTAESRTGRTINSSKINTTEDVQQLHQDLNDRYVKLFQDIKGGRKPNEVVRKEAEELGWNIEKIKSIPQDAMLSDAQTVAAHQIKANLTLELAETAKAYEQAPSAELKGKMNDLVSKILYTESVVKRSETYLGRAIQAKTVTPIPKEFDNSIMDILEKAGIGDVKDLGSALKAGDKIAKMSDSVSNMIGLWKAGLLTNPITHIKNILGNTAMMALRGMSDSVASGVDVMQSVFTGQRTKSTASLSSLLKGFKEGVTEIPKIFKEGGTGGKGEVYKQVKFENKTLDKVFGTYARTIFNALEAADRPFYKSAFESSLSDQARAIAKNTGKSVEEVLKNPTDDMIQLAISDAETYTFKKSNALSQVAASANRASGGAFNIIAPFTKTPSNIALTMIDYSPIGLPKEIVKQLASKTYNQRALSEAIGKAVTGTGLMYIGYKLAQRKQMTGNLPNSPSERALWDLQGKQPDSVLLGGKWIKIDTISPLGNIIAVGAELAKEGKVGANYLGIVGKQMTEQTFLQGLSQALQAVQDPEQYAGKWIQGIVTGIVPNLSSAVARGTDKYIRKSPEGIGESFKSKIPYLSQQLPPKVDIFGNKVERKSSILKEILDFTKSREAMSFPLLDEFSRLADNGETPSISDPTKSGRVKELKNQISNDKLNSFLQELGQRYKNQAEQTIRSSEYRSLPDEKKKTKIDSVKSKIIDELLKKYNYKPKR